MGLFPQGEVFFFPSSLRREGEGWGLGEVEVFGEEGDDGRALVGSEVVEGDGVVGVVEGVIDGEAQALVLEVGEELVEEGSGRGVDGCHSDEFFEVHV